MRVGIDVGGTFTDIVLIDDKHQKIHSTKVLTVPKNPAQGVLNGIEKILRMANASMADLDYMVHGHGTTIGTNALLERKGARTGLITTAGFRDVLEIARIERAPTRGCTISRWIPRNRSSPVSCELRWKNASGVKAKLSGRLIKPPSSEPSRT